MTDEINLDNFLKKIVESKNILLGIIIISFVSSIFIALSKTETFKADAYLIPPESRYIQPLNVFLSDGYRLARSSFTRGDVYRTFVLNMQSRRFQRRFFFEKEIYKNYEETNLEKSFEVNFYNNMRFSLDSKITDRSNRQEQFLKVSFIGLNPELSAKWLNDYIQMVNIITSQDFVDGVNVLISNTKNTLSSEINSKKNLAEQIKQDRIVLLEEAFSIAEDLNIIDREKSLSNQQNVILSKDENISSKSPLYLLGTKAIRSEINTLKNRNNSESFIPGFRQLQEKAKALDSIKVDAVNVRSAQIDQKAITPISRYEPKRKLIVLLGLITGFFISFLYVLAMFIISRK